MLYLFCLAGLAASVPLPQLTLEEFQSRGRSLEAPIVLVSQPYATVRNIIYINSLMFKNVIL